MTTFKPGDKVEDESLNVQGVVLETPDTEYATELNLRNPHAQRQSAFYGKIIVRVGEDHEYYADPHDLIKV